MICAKGFPSYFLIVADLIGYAKSVGIRVGPGRGSAAGSLVAYALGITDIDPIPHGLLFERFLNPERTSMPDIDIDFDDRRRGEMVRYAADKWGHDRVAQVITFGTIKTKAALKDSARIHYGQPGFAIADRITKALPPAIMAKDIPLSGITDPAHERYKEAAEVRGLIETDPDVRTIYQTALGLEGLIRNAGVHACAVIMSSEPLTEAIPLWKRPQDGAIITGWDYPSCEAIGLLKMDFLGLRNLTIIGDAIDNIKANKGIDLDLESVPLDDKPTYELLGRGDTLGVFQLDGGPMRDLLRRMQPTGFEDIVAVLALYRPGPMGQNAHNDYADRKNGRQAIKPIHPELAEPSRRSWPRPTASSSTKSRSCASRRKWPAIRWPEPTFCARRWARRSAKCSTKSTKASRRGCKPTDSPPARSRRCGTPSCRSPTTRSTNRMPPATGWSRTGRPTSRPTIPPSTWPAC
ncbi:DNA polymerase III, alpha subunit [Mycobacterium kansasii]|uniref:DNA polymerase III, alpha subunit n=1 Tax=Mycobacterium kansasii TaxID=1768 RepID=A0A1V3WI05_MYCKA|nr:DNA polymerase III, alpha subunit [Mycobacterium kansasii]